MVADINIIDIDFDDLKHIPAAEHIRNLHSNTTKKFVGLSSKMVTRPETLSDQEAAAMAEAVTANGRFPEPSMNNLWLTGIKMSRGAAATFWRAAGVSSAQVLVGKDSAVFDEGAIAFAHGLASNTSLIAVLFPRCSEFDTNESMSIGPKGGAAIGGALFTNTTLIMLSLGTHSISDGGATGCAEGLAWNTKLTDLQLDHCDIRAAGAVSLGIRDLLNTLPSNPLFSSALSHDPLPPPSPRRKSSHMQFDLELPGLVRQFRHQGCWSDRLG